MPMRITLMNGQTPKRGQCPCMSSAAQQTLALAHRKGSGRGSGRAATGTWQSLASRGFRHALPASLASSCTFGSRRSGPKLFLMPWTVTRFRIFTGTKYGVSATSTSWSVAGTRLCWSRQSPPASCANHCAWASASSESLARLRRATETAAACVTHRMLKYHQSLPWCIASLQDDRRTVEERDSIFQDIKASTRKICQLDEWFGQVFLQMHSDNDSIASLPAVLQAWAWQVWCTIALGEYTHGRNRRRSHQDNNWTTFASHSYNQERDLQSKWSLAAADEATGCSRISGGEEDCEQEKTQAIVHGCPADPASLSFALAASRASQRSAVTWSVAWCGWSASP